MDIDQALAIAGSKLPPRRLRHCQGVAETARRMADHYRENSEKAYLAGLLHDLARDMSGREILETVRAEGMVIDEVCRRVPDLLHGPAAAILLRTRMNLDDEEVLGAIKNHTLGEVGMSSLDQILFIADMIEPGRDYPGVGELRVLAYENLDRAMVYGLDSAISYCLHRSTLLHPRTIAVRNYFLQRIQAAKAEWKGD